jgi:transketolase
MSNFPLQVMAQAIRFLSVDAILKAGEGHQGVPLGMAEIATALYAKHLKHDPNYPKWFDRDRVVLSNGHGSMLLYSLLYLTGYKKISLDQIKTFRELGSHCAGHPEYDQEAGIEVTTGQLGQGIANAMGMAIAEAYLRNKFGEQLVNHFTYAFVGDGCLQEGLGQEMISLAGHLQLGKLILLMDDNQITDDGSTELSISEDVSARCDIANWHVIKVDGHDIDAVSVAIESARSDPRPSIIMAKTTIALGISRLQGQRGGHSGKLFEADADQMRIDLNWPYPSFEIPDDVLKIWRETSVKGAHTHQAWSTRLAQLSHQDQTEFVRVMQGGLPSLLTEKLNQLKSTLLAEPAKGGINISAMVNDSLTDFLPERMVACADLEAPTDHKRRLQAFTALNNDGSYIHCGVREHLMGAMANGMAAHGGIIPVSVTYLMFTDYMRPAMRMAALMGLPVKFVFSHDSIGIGKNGPTHQPVEVLASLRAMPNMLVMRPADSSEAVECWQVALSQQKTPVSLVFARQVLPHVRHTISAENLCALGAYILEERDSVARQITLLATGSEVLIAKQACSILLEKGFATAVVSMPCWELFDKQTLEYRNSVLQPGTTTVAVEAAVAMGWERYLGSKGGFVGMTGYGASGPAEALYSHFDITVQSVVDLALSLHTQ